MANFSEALIPFVKLSSHHAITSIPKPLPPLIRELEYRLHDRAAEIDLISSGVASERIRAGTRAVCVMGRLVDPIVVRVFGRYEACLMVYPRLSSPSICRVLSLFVSPSEMYLVI